MVSVFGAMTNERKVRIWELWEGGWPMSEIARDIAKPPATVYSYLLYHGGIQPRKRKRRATCLSMDEREAISRGLACGESIRGISRKLGRNASTISREIGRNGGATGYRACAAEQAFHKRSKRPKPFLFAQNPALKEIVVQKLESDWSPEQIAGWLKTSSSQGELAYVSHETIYKSLFIQTLEFPGFSGDLCLVA
ncbi:helix-turn-helix domain-containing protein [Azonexus sp.]|uniref:helix-turn-helix domain-containing protein n=1 Tax=Azonexus sp. TaxID=1872668 RepID=UPI0027BA63D2|nr:helix-turn-helix domain-containing protein [Azonexus sp.]